MKASDLLYNWDEKIPVDPTQFCRNCEVSVKWGDMCDIDYDSREITIDQRMIEQVARFQVAYCLGKILDVKDPNEFALELLMPEPVFIQQMNNIRDVEKVAYLFGVDFASVRARYYQLRKYFVY